jgi:acetolactate decarboxylase
MPIMKTFLSSTFSFFFPPNPKSRSPIPNPADCRLPTAYLLRVIPVALILILACSSHKQSPTLTQISAMDALMAGCYDGVVPVKDLRRYGDFGIGTYKRLDGEMVMLNDTLFQILLDGTAKTASIPDSTPFADVVRFKPDTMLVPEKNIRLDSLKSGLVRTLSDKNLIYAVRISGSFKNVKTRSVPPQIKPYLPLGDVVATLQKITDTESSTGTIVGFYFPAFMKNVNVTGFHMHFISGDRKLGGHLFDCVLAEGTVERQTIGRFFMILPGSGSCFNTAGLDHKPSNEAKKVMELTK